MHLLLVDDDQELVAVLTIALMRAGFTVHTARDAFTALALAQRYPPVLIVLGTPLRASDALVLLDHLRQRSQAVIIMLIGRGDEDARVAGLERGADDYVRMPVSPRELVARVRARLRHRHPPPPDPSTLD